MRVLITGSRDWDNLDLMLDVMCELPSDTVIIHGGSLGADSMADAIAKHLGMERKKYKADWSSGSKREGLYRNSQMLYESKPDRVIGFRSRKDSKGTNDMLFKAGKAGIPHDIYDDWRQ